MPIYEPQDLSDIEVDVPERPETMEYRKADEGLFPIDAKAIRFNGVLILTGKGSPLNVVAAPLGSLYLNQSGGANTSMYIKETEVTKNDKTGWTAK